ncbi:MAG: patatin-like phospholipase family protein, partial [Candidatus Accumulibacter sp.]|nr:patatin-like phospholipase family protein [Accumulibacter sp.]
MLQIKFHNALPGLTLLAALAAPVAAAGAAVESADGTPTAVPARPRIGLVLSGGGARGIAHLGVLRVLDELRVPVDCVAGTSMGGVVGGVFASGMPLDEMERQVRAIDWSATFQDRPDRRAMNARRKSEESGYLARPEFGLRDGEILVPGGVLYGQRMEMLFARLAVRSLGIDDFSRFPLPFKAVATDIESGMPVVLDKGGLVQAMRATMSVPGVMAPMEIDGRALVDGGLVNNLPVDVARGMCADVVIAVNLGTPLLKRAEIRSVFGVGVQMVNILTEQNVRASLASLGADDVLISPELGAIGAGDFDRIDDLVAAGEAAARQRAPALRALAVAPEA